MFVQSDDRKDDGCKSLKDRLDSDDELKKLSRGKTKDEDVFQKKACEKWIDVRAFGQLFAFGDEKSGSVSSGIRGPVSLHPAFSIDPIEIESIQITKSVDIYKLKGSINCQLAEKTGFSDEDAEKIREALATLFENDSSAARPDGSMCMEKLFWFRHNCKSGQYSTAKVHRSVKAEKLCENPKSAEDYRFYYDESLEGLVPEVIV